MPWTPPNDPVTATVITVAYARGNILDPVRWLRLMTGNADPPGSSYVVVADSTSGTSWRKVPADALAAGVAVANLGYTPVNRAGDLTLTGPLGWAPTAYVNGGTNQLFLVTGQMIYLIDSASAGTPVGTIDVVNKSIALPGGNISTGSLTLSAGLAMLAGTIQAATAAISGAFQAASAVISGNASINGTLGVAGAATINGTTTAAAINASGNVITTQTVVGSRLVASIADGLTPPISIDPAQAGLTVANLRAATAALATNATNATNAGNATTAGGAAPSTTAGAGRIPIADASGKLDPAWLPSSGISGVPSNLIAAVAIAAQIPAGWTRYSTMDGLMPVGAGTSFSVGFTENTSYGSSWSHAHADGGVHAHSGSPLFVSGTTDNNNGSNSAQLNPSTPGFVASPGPHTHGISSVPVGGNTANNVAVATSSDRWIIPCRAVVYVIKT